MIAVHLENGRVSMRAVPRPRRPEGFALIRPLLAGICNTHLELQRGYYGFRGTPGHEFAGEVVEADTRSLVGRRVAGEINLACNACEWCRRGLGRHCPKRTVLGIVKHPGAFRELLTLPERNLHVIPASITNEQAVFVEPLAAACEILDQVRIPKDAEVALLGDGKLGLLIAHALQSSALRVHLYGRHKAHLKIAAASGIETFFRKKLPLRRYDFTIDATGSPEGLAQAIGMTRPRGTVILKSTIHGLVPLDTAHVIVQEITLVGSRCGRFEPALRLLAKGKVRVDPLISGIFDLRDAPRAFARAAEPGVLKVLLRIP